MSDKPQPSIPNVVGRLDDFVEKMKQGKTINAAYVLDAERDRRQDKVVALKKHLAREQEAVSEIVATRKILSAYIAYAQGMDDTHWNYPGWKKDFNQLCVACGREPEEWLPDEEPVDNPAVEPELEPMRVLATAVRIFRERGNHEVAGVLADVGHCRGVEPYPFGSENE